MGSDSTSDFMSDDHATKAEYIDELQQNLFFVVLNDKSGQKYVMVKLHLIVTL